ncbi:MAG: AMP-binding protein, partial [Alphaproteobacteria bacterium]|nr:AMP-binding protein [Alphaproteobacteria bacterium]
GGVTRHSFRDIDRLARRFANALAAQGVGRGDRVAVLLSQGLELPVAHLGAYRVGAIVLPLFALFGPDAIRYRLENSGAKALVTDAANWPKVEALRADLPTLAACFVAGAAPAGAREFWAEIARASDMDVMANTGPDDPALIMYTSGTTGPPKGALQAHRVVLGHLPGVEFPHDVFPQPGDLFWTPADWAWAGGLLDVLWPAWHHGVAVVAQRARKFDPEAAFAFMARHGVRNAFLPPTALKLMRQVAHPAPTRLRSVGSGGEPLGAELIEWGRQTLGVTINEFYGQTECNLVLGNCAALFPPRPGSMGVPIPGHDVQIVDETGTVLPDGTTGQVAIRRPDPVMFLEYWRNPEATRRKFAGDWLLTGDLARRDGDGFFWFMGREDDVITSGAYRIGPGEIEECLLAHPAIAMAAAVGVPDPVRTEAVKAFVVLKPGMAASDALAAEIQAHVKTRLAAHEYPRAIEFVSALPMTATGKIMRRVLRDAERAKSKGEPA